MCVGGCECARWVFVCFFKHRERKRERERLRCDERRQ